MCWTIYDKPDDYPNHFVVRQWDAQPTGIVPYGVTTFDTLEEARLSLRKRRLVSLGREPQDDPKIVETWL